MEKYRINFTLPHTQSQQVKAVFTGWGKMVKDMVLDYFREGRGEGGKGRGGEREGKGEGVGVEREPK